MGWSSGSELMRDIISSLNAHGVKNGVQVEIYKDLIRAFENYDCDTLYECIEDDICFKTAYKELNSEEFNKEEE